jgi:DNA invertase Pin-like site-specific DNA recombinase
MTQTAVAYYRTSSATNVGQVSIREKSPPDPPFPGDGSLQDGTQCPESTNAPHPNSGTLHSDKDSLMRQQQAVRACAAARGLHIVHEYYDAAVSGSDPVNERPAFREMVQYMLGNGARTIIVENASRFARDQIVQETGYQMLKARGIELIAADTPEMFLADTPTAKFIRVVLGAVSELDKTMLVEKLRGARDRKSRLAGERIEGRRDWKALRNPQAIEMARSLTGTLSLRQISAKLFEAGFAAASGKPYGAQSIKRMLQRKS